MPLASISNRIDRPEQASRHSLDPELDSSERSLGLKRFSATAKVSRPGRNPASSVSFLWCNSGNFTGPALGDESCFCVGGAAAAGAHAAASARLAQIHNFIEPR